MFVAKYFISVSHINFLGEGEIEGKGLSCLKYTVYKVAKNIVLLVEIKMYNFGLFEVVFLCKYFWAITLETLL